VKNKDKLANGITRAYLINCWYTGVSDSLSALFDTLLVVVTSVCFKGYFFPILHVTYWILKNIVKRRLAHSILQKIYISLIIAAVCVFVAMPTF